MMEIAFVIFTAVVLAISLLIASEIIGFFISVPVQLKRIADALEKDGE